MMDPALIVALANARAVRRPTGARTTQRYDALADAARAHELLASFCAAPVTGRELAALRELQRAVAAIVEALIDGLPAPMEPLNRLARAHPAARMLVQRPDATMHVTLRFGHPTAAAILTQQAISELAGLDPGRLRRCERPECRLAFYDCTRSGTRRWHSDRPCGLRERQRRHRARSAADGLDSYEKSVIT
jgi:predicted RNA-binding Zn ribbon-like protein